MNGDGCSTNCLYETGWICTGAIPDVCTPRCGDGIRRGIEVCDDGITDINGCNSACSGTRTGWTCSGGSLTTADICVSTCGDLIKVGTE